MSADGKIALPSRKQVRLSNKEDSKRVNDLRKNCDAILVGIGTIIEDNPKLTVKNTINTSINPIRIVLDTKGRTPLESNVLNKEAKTIIAVGNKCKVNKLGNSEIIKCGNEKINIKKLIQKLSEKGIKNILVEGGETVLWSFINENLFDQINIFIASKIIGGEKTPTMAGGDGFYAETSILKLSLKHVEKIGDGILLTYCKK
tara:strand:- start:2665 stop:3270 length:606 start_codon:yes stop_codon:yes gene_type:complete